MSTSPTKASGKAKGWTDTEKVGLFLQMIAKTGVPIPWNDLVLPEGRTLKACQVMFDKEKTKVKQAAAANGEEVPETPKGKKRAAKDSDAAGEESKAKKPKTPRKKAVVAGADEDDADAKAEKSKVKEEDAAEDEV